jgi:hypothetical protein
MTTGTVFIVFFITSMSIYGLFFLFYRALNKTRDQAIQDILNMNLEKENKLALLEIEKLRNEIKDIKINLKQINGSINEK